MMVEITLDICGLLSKIVIKRKTITLKRNLILVTIFFSTMNMIEKNN